MKDELHHIISGKSQVRYGAIIQAIARYLRESTSTGEAIENEKHFKKEETAYLEKYCTQNNLWITGIDLSQYVSKGAEQKVYLKDKKYVVKLNDAIYYVSWIDYLHNLLLHNYFFADDEILYAVVKQPFVAASTVTNLDNVRKFLIQNGFENSRNNDYIHTELGIILGDLHDENVLTQNEILYFIDTVFYLTEHFWDDAQ